MSETNGNMKKAAWAAGVLAFGIFGWLRIRETLPPRADELKAMLASALAETPASYTAEYGEEFDLLAQLPGHYGKAYLQNEIDTAKTGTQYTQIFLEAEARDASKVKAGKIVSVRVEDTQPPAVTFEKQYDTVPLHGEYDPSANILSVSDPVDGEITAAEKPARGAYTVTSDVVTGKAGVYTVRVTARDKNGTESVSEYPVTVESYVLAGPESDPEELPRIAFSKDRLELAVGEEYEAADALLAVTSHDGKELAEADELAENTYTVSGFAGDTSKAGIYRVTVRAMNENGDTASAFMSVSVGTPEEIAAAMNVDPSSAAGQVYLFLTGEAGFNRAAACGIMANISRESGYRPTADNSGLYHGLCQWGGGRLSYLYDWCWGNGYDPESIDGQLNYMMFELQTKYTGVLEVLRNVPDSADGAWQAGASFVAGFEGVPGLEGSTGARAAELYYTN